MREVLFIVMGFIFVALSLSLYGSVHVIVRPFPQITAVEEPLGALYVWNEGKVRGRVLVLFDRHLHAEAEASPLAEPPVAGHNFVYHAVQLGIVKKIYHVIPDRSWHEVEQNLFHMAGTAFSHDRFRLNITEGVPVTVLRIKDVPHIREKVLMSIQGDHWSEEELDTISSMLYRRVFESDLITAYHVPERHIRGLQEYGRL